MTKIAGWGAVGYNKGPGLKVFYGSKRDLTFDGGSFAAHQYDSAGSLAVSNIIGAVVTPASGSVLLQARAAGAFGSAYIFTSATAAGTPIPTGGTTVGDVYFIAWGGAGSV